MARLIRLSAFTFLCLFASGARADLFIGECRLYFRDDQTVHEEVRDIFAFTGGDAIEACTVGKPDTYRYTWISPVIEGSLGTCIYKMRPVFFAPEREENHAWSFWPPSNEAAPATNSIFMAKQDGECRRQDDPGYTWTSGVSEGVFLTLVRFWERLSSIEEFDALIAQAVHDPWNYAGLEGLREAIISGAVARSEVRLFGILLEESAVGDSNETATAHYSLHLVGGALGSWVLVVDFVDGEVRLLSWRILQ